MPIQFSFMYPENKPSEKSTFLYSTARAFISKIIKAFLKIYDKLIFIKILESKTTSSDVLFFYKKHRQSVLTIKTNKIKIKIPIISLQ